MDNYLTLKQATETTGKSQRQLRRLCNDPKNKGFVTYDDKGRLLVDANFLAQSYPLINVPIVGESIGKPIKSDAYGANGMTSHSVDNLMVKVAQLEQEIRHKDDSIRVIQESSQQLIASQASHIESLKQSLLMLNAGKPVITPQDPADPEPIPEPEPPKRKKFLGLF